MSVHMLLNPKPLASPPFFSLSSSHAISFFHSPSFPNKPKHTPRVLLPFSSKSDPAPNPKSNQQPSPPSQPQNVDPKTFPKTIPRKPKRGRKSEAAAVEDFVREKLEQTFESIRQQNPEFTEQITEHTEKAFKNKKKDTVIEQEDPNWPVDADIGWGIRSSEYFNKHSIKNVVGDDGAEIDWEGEVEDNYVKEINCLEWESFAFHPSPLIVLVFERYNNASENWRYLMELEKAVKVYWNAKDRLPPRTVKIDINIERDMAYALKVREGPQLLFLRGNRILYREKEVRSKDELVQMIAHFYYNAKKPSWIDDSAVLPP